MRAPGYRWTTLILVVTVALIIGCRGSRPFNPLVQVTQEPDADLPEIQPPRQRLATAKPRMESGLTTNRSRRSDGSPHVTTAASSRPNAAARSETTSKSAKAQRSVASRRSTAAKTTQQARVPAPTTNGVERMVGKKSAPSEKGKPTKDLDPSQMMDAFSDYPPEVQREALRRLVAATSRSADKTLQPNSLDSELAKNILNLPKLPDAKNTKTEVPPTRIASDDSSHPSTVDLVSDEQELEAEGGENGVRGRVTDLETTELESPVQRISDSDANDKTVVKTALGSRTDGDESILAQSALEPIEPSELSVLKKNADDATIASDSEQLSEKALYAALLKRLSTAVPGESEADRSGRLIKLRHLMVLSGDPDAAVGKIEGLAEAEQEYLRHHLLGLWTMIDPEGHPVPSRRFTTALPQIREAAKFAAAATDSLDVRSLAFCTEIESYGQIKTFPGNRFDAGQQVILYCEIENFTVNHTDDGFETNLQGSYDIYNSDNEKVVSQLLPADKQVSANYLRDYFIAYQMHLPQQLSGGTYRLQLTMEDVNGKKYGQASIPFEIAK